MPPSWVKASGFDTLFELGLSIDPAARTGPAPTFQFHEPTFEVAEATGELAAGRMTLPATVARAVRQRRDEPFRAGLNPVPHLRDRYPKGVLVLRRSFHGS
ncbi:hypothetical protein [Roseovarius sp. THAF9]|uniref:hypothetical protein n=1 Tax=Roseovarius sp. THAF9 TaxID=2587847 RepID=UPI0012698712|nr:hypothetical protein [Roseovarius sp. THAF9]